MSASVRIVQRVVVSMVGVLLLAACADDPAALTPFQRAAIDWEASGVEDYSYTFVATGFCGEGAVRITVRDGVVADVGDLPARCIHSVDAAVSIPDLIAFLSVFAGNPELATATFDPVHGYPSLVVGEIDERMLDDQFSFSVVDFVAE